MLTQKDQKTIRSKLDNIYKKNSDIIKLYKKRLENFLKTNNILE